MTGDFVLLLFAIIVAVFTGAAWFRLMTLLRTDAEERRAIEEWYEAKKRAREDSSSLQDDFNSGLPDHWQEGRDGVVEFKPRDAA